MPAYIFVAGGVISGIGKGVVTSSIGKLLQSAGLSVTAVKMDPYINMDAGTMRPTEHGEVWVTSDGGEIDQDFGHYERFLDIEIPKANNITTGQVYSRLIEEERAGKFLGKTVQFIPHVPSEIRRRIESCAKGFDICLVEIGGTIGDYENIPFVFAAKDLALDNPSAFVLVVYLPTPPHLGEVKSKPAQHAIKEMRQLGAEPDFIVCRSENELDRVRKGKIATYQNILEEHIISAPDLENIYELPMVLQEQHMPSLVLRKLGMRVRKTDIKSWNRVVKRMARSKKRVRIAFASKYVDIGASRLPDAYISINEALRHAGARLGVGVDITYLDASGLRPSHLKGFHGLVVPPGFGSSCVDGKITAIRHARTKNLPFLGICYGMQLAVVEFARNVCNMRAAHTTEVDPKTPYPVIDVLPEQRKILDESAYGGTMRLGSYPALLEKGSLIRSFYRRRLVRERHRHRYEVNPLFIGELESKGMVFSGVSPDRRLMEFMELPHHPCFVGTQSHPEYNSRLMRPSPIYIGFLRAAADQL